MSKNSDSREIFFNSLQEKIKLNEKIKFLAMLLIANQKLHFDVSIW